MEKNTAKTFLYDETFKLVKKELDVQFLNPEVMLAVSERAIASIGYWERRASKGTKEQKQMYNIEIAKLEALMQRMTDMSLDVYEVNATAYLDTRGDREDKSVEEILTDVAAKADIKVDVDTIPAEETPVFSIFDGEAELKTPKLTDLSAAIKVLLKKGRFDSANLMAAKFLTVGDYIPKKEKQQPVKWSEEKIASWIRDINDSLMSEKTGAKKEIENQETTNVKKEESDVASKGLTNTEDANLKLLETMIPEAIAGHQDYQSRREVLNHYLNLGKDINAENTMLWAFAKRIGDAYASPKIPEAAIPDLHARIDKFSKIFFAHRPYTEDSVKAWTEAAKKEASISNFNYLRTKADVDPLKLQKSGISMEAIKQRVEAEYLAGKTVQEVLAGLEEGILYKLIESKDKTTTSIYTKLHAKDLIERIYSVYSTKAKDKPAEVKGKGKVETAATIISADKSKVDIAEVKLLLSVIAENGGIFDDVKTHPEILNLINREIQDNSKSPALKFGHEATLFPYLEAQFNVIVSKLSKVEATNTIEYTKPDASKEPIEVESKTADLNNMLTLCDFAARNDVSQEDFIKEHQPIVMTKEGGFKSLMSPTAQGGSKTISISSANDFAVWVSSVYKTVEDETKKPIEDPELVKSMKDLHAKGKELLEKGTTYEQFMEWLKKNLLNRKLLEQKPDKYFKSVDAVISFAKNTWGKKIPKPVDVVAETLKTIEENKAKEVGEPAEATVMSIDEINTHIAEMSVKEGLTLYSLIRMLRDLYVKNNILIEEEACTLKNANGIVEAIIKESNPIMYTERQQRKAELALQKKGQLEIPLEDENNIGTKVIGPVESETETVVEDDKTDTNIVEAEYSVFEKVDVSVTHPTLWPVIEKFNSIDQVYNQAVEFDQAGDFNSALSMCLVMLPKIDASKDWTPEYITDWFNKMILKKTVESEVVSEVDETSTETQEVIELGEEFNGLKEAKNPKSFKRCIADILQSKEDNTELRNQIIAAINSGKGSHTRQVAKMPDTEKHKQINNIKEKMKKHETVESN